MGQAFNEERPMDFYMNPLSPNCRKVDAVAKQIGVQLNTKIVDVRKGEHRSPAYLAINPNGMIPALVDGDVTLWESNVIQCYIASKNESDLWPRSNLRYEIRRWQAWELAHFGAAARQLIFQRVLKPLFGICQADVARCQDEEQSFRRFAAVFDAQLKGKRFVVGDQLTVADFCIAPSLGYAVLARIPIAEFPQIQRWLKSLDDQPGWRATTPPPM
jgi:glutathione S-transferase